MKARVMANYKLRGYKRPKASMSKTQVQVTRNALAYALARAPSTKKKLFGNMTGEKQAEHALYLMDSLLNQFLNEELKVQRNDATP